MNIQIKHMLYTFSLVSLFSIHPVSASGQADDVETIGGAPVPAPAPAIMEEVAPPIFSAEDAVQLMNFTKMIMTLTEQINETGVKGTEAKKAFVDLLLKKNGTVDQSLNLLQTIAEKIDQQLQAMHPQADSGCAKCIAGYHKIVKPVNSGINQVLKLLPVIEKYTDFFLELEGQGLSADQYFNKLLAAGVLTDLNNLLKSTLSYNANEAPKRVQRAAKLQVKKAKLAAKQAPKPVQPIQAETAK